MTADDEILAAVDAPHFNAGIVLRGGRVTEAAPILRYMVGWSRDRVRQYCRGKGWSVTVVRRRDLSNDAETRR